MDTAFEMQTWQQAFEQHPISTTRTIEKRLRASVANNREKLRTLVGGNYRELLSTAEQIVSLDGQVKTTESHISGISRQCKPLSQQQQSEAGKVTRIMIIAQLRLLQQCIAAANSALGRSDLLLSAQVIVIARLLAKSLTDEGDLLKSLPSLRGNTVSLRRQLLLRVNIILTHPHSSLSAMVDASCAYCLINSAAFQDLFKHVSMLRLARLRKHLERPTLHDQQVVEALRYCITSLRILRHLTGRPVIDALSNLQKQPIIESSNVMDLEILNLKGIGALIPPEIRTFIPYFKRTPFATDEVREALLSWSSDAWSILETGLERLLLSQREVVRVLELRRALFAILLPVYFSCPGMSSIQQAIHRVLTKRVEVLINDHVKQLTAFADNVVSSTPSEACSGNLWEEGFTKMSLRSGAAAFIRQTHCRRRGTSRHLESTTCSLLAWISSTTALNHSFDELRKIRWRDMLEEPDEAQEDEANQVIEKLSKDGPLIYSVYMRTGLVRGFDDLERVLVKTIASDVVQNTSADAAVEHLRTIRELVVPLRQAFPNNPGFQVLDKQIPSLHGVIAAELLIRVSTIPEGDMEVRKQQEGASIDNLPSPRAFGFLYRLCVTMLEIGGTDLWSSAAVKVIKATFAERVFDQKFQSVYIESTFDEEYLAIVLGHPASELRGSAEERTAAEDYWARTKLLFGVLAV